MGSEFLLTCWYKSLPETCMKSLAALLLFCCHSLLGQSPIDTAMVVHIGGINQFVSIKGKDVSKPILLFLHGGPGSSMMGYSEKFTRQLQEHFIVVQWDQRETGKTLAFNPSPRPLSLDLFQDDTHELITHLLKQFNKPKVYLAGHSWGTALGFHIAGKYPDLLYAYIAIAPMTDQIESERIVLELMKEKARREGDQKQVSELSQIKIPFENGEQLYHHRKWLQHFNGKPVNLKKQFVLDWSETWLSVFNEASKNNLFGTLPAIECPVYFFLGRKDYQTNYTVAEKYYNTVKAPLKKLFWFERSGHFIPTTEPSKLQDVIINSVYPETYMKLSPAPVTGVSTVGDEK